MITKVGGVRLGHWTHPVARTGCTVVLLPAGTVASGKVGGGAPGTREFELLDPRRAVDRVNAVVLTGGSAFGLAACDGVTRWCEERGIGWPTPAGPVPIVVGMVIFDLTVGDASVRPGPDEGYAACVAARAGEIAEGHGLVGAGTGATVGKWQGRDVAPRPAGLGSAVVTDGELVVAALAVVNAVGDALEPAFGPRPRIPPTTLPPVATTATTIGVIVTNARADKLGCLRAAEAGHDGLARALDPAHTAADGDAIVAAATGRVEASPGVVPALSAWVFEQAVNDALYP
jgi:L-aminopeptidase/D-esterase-like protein